MSEMLESILNVVIADDTNHKMELIIEAVRKCLPQAKLLTYDCCKEAAYCLCRAHCKEILEHPEQWLVITDMQMPLYSGESEINPTAGRHVLAEMSIAGLECPALIASSEAVDNSAMSEIYAHYIGSLQVMYRCDIKEPLRKLLVKSGYLPAVS